MTDVVRDMNRSRQRHHHHKSGQHHQDHIHRSTGQWNQGSGDEGSVVRHPQYHERQTNTAKGYDRQDDSDQS